MKKVLFFILLIVAFLSCKKMVSNADQIEIPENKYKSNSAFFQRDRALQGLFYETNKQVAEEPLLGTLLYQLEKADRKLQYSSKVSSQFGKPVWDLGIALKNANGYKSLIVPIVNEKKEITAAIIVYQETNIKLKFKIISKRTIQKKLKPVDPNGIEFTQDAILFIFDAFSKKYALLNTPKPVEKIKTNAITVSWACSYSSYFYADGDTWYYVTSNMRCTYSMTMDGAPYEALEPVTEGNGVEWTFSYVDVIPLKPVKDSLTNPCMDSAFKKVTETKIKNLISDFYQNTQKTSSNTLTVIIKNVSHVYGSSNQDILARSIGDVTNNTWTIELNDCYVSQGMSQENWGMAIIHEILHCFINSNYPGVALDGNDHPFILKNLITPTKDLLVSAFGMSESDAKAFALNGLGDLFNNSTNKDGFRAYADSVYGTSISDTDTLWVKYLDGRLGTRCSR
ncbi:MAG: hypothetical protein V4450_00010 [Bacteroidota bacterium]